MQAPRIRQLTALLAIVGLLLASCAPTRPLPQPRRVVDPSASPNAVRGELYDIAAVGYDNYGQGLDYAAAGLTPVLLVVRNKSLDRPRIDPQEARGVAADGEYLPYTLSEAERLVFASETFGVTASNAARSGLLLGALGAGLGALIGVIGGGDNIWKGAAIGGGIGAAAGVAGSTVEAESDLKKVIHEELSQYAWTGDPLPADYTKVGYIYLPGGVGVHSVKIVVRHAGVGDSATYTLPIDQPPPR